MLLTAEKFATAGSMLQPKSFFPRVDFSLTVDWHDHDRILKIAFPTQVENSFAFYEQPYGYIERVAAGSEWPAQNWIDLSNKDFGGAMKEFLETMILLKER